jgi:phosphoenolpyruvate synthase/pyruvate phosphate dikinase
MGKTCVVGCGEVLVDEEALEFRRGDLKVRQGEVISLNGETGEVLLGEIPTRPSEVPTARLTAAQARVRQSGKSGDTRAA